ncbi:unnamed protein product [Sphenostylis stenocarpa]|uniref:Uncharacterized protein n=1 Tax=Sphenostylis stenocarpa TaxID=92480 RepID=A0AA86S838_9FABA|nr:unnamed protein product [Sphenostylis stenocarpa]
MKKIGRICPAMSTRSSIRFKDTQSVRLNKILLTGRWIKDTAPSYPGYRNSHN